MRSHTLSPLLRVFGLFSLTIEARPRCRLGATSTDQTVDTVSTTTTDPDFASITTSVSQTTPSFDSTAVFVSSTTLSVTSEGTSASSEPISDSKSDSTPDITPSSTTSSPESTASTSSISSTTSTPASDPTASTEPSTTSTGNVIPDITSSDSTATPSSTNSPTLAPSITYLENGGFDDSSSSISPWDFTPGASNVELSIDSGRKRDGSNSARLDFTSGFTTHGYIAQALDTSKISPGVAYQFSAWIGVTDTSEPLGCADATLYATYPLSGQQVTVNTAREDFYFDTWSQFSVSLTFTEAMIATGQILVYVDVRCTTGNTAWIDTVKLKPV